MDSIDDSSTDYNSDYGFIGTNSIEDIQYGNQMHPYISARDARLKICDRIKQTQNE